MDNDTNVQINMQRIPVGSSIGAAVLIAILLTGMFLDLPGVRGTAIGGGAIGLLLAWLLIRRRRRTVGSSVHPTLGITGR
jgi:membrane associated rhomboid family serine protease